MDKILTLDEFSALNIKTSERSRDSLSKAIALRDEVIKFHPCEVVIDTSNNIYPYHASVKLQSNIHITIYKGFGDSFYSFILDEYHNLKNTDSSVASRVANDIEEPQRMCTLSEKKIKNWIKYYEVLYNKLAEIDRENADKKDAFIKSLEGLDVIWDHGGTRGRIIRGGLEYMFYVTSAKIYSYIYIWCTVDGSLSEFLAMTDNKYVGAPLTDKQLKTILDIEETMYKNNDTRTRVKVSHLDPQVSKYFTRKGFDVRKGGWIVK